MRIVSSLSLKSLWLIFTIIFRTLPIAKPLEPITTKLIHHDSIFSPFYNPNDTIEDRAKRMLNSSRARLNHLQAKHKRNLQLNDNDQPYEANLVALNGIFLINFSIGSPPIPQLAIMDTGSDLMWIQCKPCEKCFSQPTPIYDPSLSSTYSNSSCSDFSWVYRRYSQDEPNCVYNVTYQDGTGSRGTTGAERLWFETADDGLITLDNVTFGCGHYNNEFTTNVNLTGVFGLQDADGSITNKLGFGFSYCVGDISDPNYEYNRLTIGDKLKMEGYSTPLHISFSGGYYVNLLGIAVGEEKLNINPQVFQLIGLDGKLQGNVMIDSGSTLTYLPNEAYDAVRNKVWSLLDGLFEEIKVEDQLCYRSQGNLYEDLKGFPDVTFQLSDGVDLVLEAGSLFYNAGNKMFCLAIMPAGYDTIMIGMLAQQYYNVAFDLQNHKLYLQRIDCQLMND